MKNLQITDYIDFLLVRSPCPMLNSLANHGFLDHSGKKITRTQIQNTFSTVLNIGDDLIDFLWKAALTTVPTPNATSFSLENLNTHDILEHDGSLRFVHIP
jgi:hypothetical protein